MSILVLDYILEKVVKALKKDENALEAYLFGSMARGDYHLESDIDILVVSEDPKQTSRELSEIVSDLSVEYGVAIGVVVEEAKNWNMGASSLYNSVMKEGRRIWMQRKR